jgi:hypothetical protein
MQGMNGIQRQSPASHDLDLRIDFLGVQVLAASRTCNLFNTKFAGEIGGDLDLSLGRIFSGYYEICRDGSGQPERSHGQDHPSAFLD